MSEPRAAAGARRVLVVEDDRDLARLVRLHLAGGGCEVELSYDGREGLRRALGGSYDLVVLDLSLPGLDGLDVCRTMRERGCVAPVLMLTARTSETDRVLGLELGADDYLGKPFGIRELVARVRAIFRRRDLEALAAARDPEEIRAGELVVSPPRREVSIRGEPVELTPREFDLLAHFARNPGRVLTRTELLDRVWGYRNGGYEHTVNVHINRLRSKIEDDPARPRYVLTVWGVGYKFAERP